MDTNAHTDSGQNDCRGDVCLVMPPRPSASGVIYRVPAMDCAAEEGDIRRAVTDVPGIAGLAFSPGTRTLTVYGDETAQAAAVAAIRRTGFEIEKSDGATSESAHNAKGGLWRPALGLVCAIAAEAVGYFAPETMAFKIAGMSLATIAIGLAGFSVYKKGMSALLHAKLNINALMSIAVTGAFLIGQWPEAAMVMALYAIAELIEARSVERARNAIKSLMALAPDMADVQQPDETWLAVPVGEVQLGAIARVHPGERLPLDGIVIRGSSAVNQAPVTGESIPVDKQAGDPVFAGTINESGAIEFRVTALSTNTTLARIIHAVEEAQSKQAPTQRFVDRFAAIYTPGVFVMAVTIAFAGPFVFGWGWMLAAYKALVLLVIACPCALVISTPVTVVSGLTAAARRGILIKGGVFLERLCHIKAIALDKTGTITEGKPRLVSNDAWNGHARAQLESIAAAMAHASDHPVSKAIAAGLPGSDLKAVGIKALPGRGIEAQVEDKTYVLGNHRLIEDRNQCSRELETLLVSHEQQGHTVTMLAGESGVMAVFAVADTIRPSSPRAIAELAELGVVSIMLTGDNQKTADAIAAEAGIKESRGSLLPEDKLRAIKTMQARYGLTAMTGDGINDAPALAQADIGVAMGGAGTDAAMEAADMVVMNDDLQRIPEAVRLSRRTVVVLRQNISLALTIKAVFFALAVFGSATMWMAVFADMGASLIVVANGLRLLRVPR